MRKLIVGNWKMNGIAKDLPKIKAIAGLSQTYSGTDCGICLPATLISRATQQTAGFSFGGQDCHHSATGAYTGCISADMLIDAGANMVIIGHSERRIYNNETDADVHAKALAAGKAGLHAIICVGETEAQRDIGNAEATVLAQLLQSVPQTANSTGVSIAYEPVWAIGTGRIPSEQDVKTMHAAIRANLFARFGNDGAKMPILYGGSMNGDNASMLLAIENVDGGLIGGASLSADKFEPILAAANAPPQ